LPLDETVASLPPEKNVPLLIVEDVVALINFFGQEVAAKRLGLLHDLVPKAVRIAVLVNPANASTAEATLRDIPEPARAIGLQIQVLNASTSREIEAAFAILVREQAEALFVAADGFFVSRRVQFATLATR
jgi:putative tryptophan/tyrosine transport system substrate-binding protein